MRFRGLLILTLLTLGVGAFIWFVERDLPTTEELQSREDRLLAIDAEDVHRVTLIRGGQEVVLERDLASEVGGEEAMSGLTPKPPWRLASPLQARADAVSVDQLIGQVVGLETVRVLEETDAAPYGLDPPELRVSLETEEGIEQLDVGEPLPASTRRVARLGDEDRLFVIEMPFFETASKPAGDWRDKRLFPGREMDVERIRLQSDRGEVLLARRGERFWLESPVTDVAGPDRVDALLTTIADFQAERFVDDPEFGDAEIGLDPPRGVVEVVLAGEEQPFRILWGSSTRMEIPSEDSEGDYPSGADSSYFARVDGVLVESASALHEPLERSAAEWRSYLWMPLASYEVDRVHLEDGIGELDLTRDGVDWQRGDESVSYTVVNRLLSALVDLRAESIEDREPPSSEPALTIGLTDKEGILTTLKLYPPNPDDGSAVATTSGRPAILRLDSASRDAVVAAIQAVREAEAIEEEPAPGEGMPLDLGALDADLEGDS